MMRSKRMRASVQQMSVVGLIMCVAMPARAENDAAESTEMEQPDSHSSRVGANIGGVYTSNMYGNASQTPDFLGVVDLALDSDLMPSSSVIVKLDYRGALELYGDLTNQRNYGHDGAVTLGFRPADTLYVSVRAGAEHAFFPDRPQYNFWGLSGRVAARWEVGDASTVELRYGLRSDQFPEYDLDNLAHQGDLQWSTTVGDYVELELPATYRATFYRERYLLASAGQETSAHATNQRVNAAPTIVILPSYDLEIATALSGEYNYSDDTYLYIGPTGVMDPTVDQELISHFFSYWGAGMNVTVRWNPIDTLLLKTGVDGGTRGFTHRPAYDQGGMTVGEYQLDLYFGASATVEWRLFDLMVIGTNYRFLRHWSNDTLVWDFTLHRVNVFLGTWWEN
ncbi:MAG: hypothetical protein A2341_04815 [Deltaproteobacteria bacterium RIFOXYB12_FULL_58_9]|nr:MAG: hypothetical protein A2341_04815 [Deltaproteobacteria bacterium RIFOXYB12_FULL_58_9]